ncbi:MAG TPA: hypothetical protein PKE01_12760 [Rhodocyclaceae bacterium]|nr:hypothetical protein [Rhodocyclaceae bacterium]HMZ56273.1 hypothetical protein [Nitrospira sp.]HNI69585.1 hypothetical protein [Nitrospira sp.]
MDLLSGNFQERLRSAISFAWGVFSRKVGSGIIHINKEASMQLHFANILTQVLPLITVEADESSHVELETGVKVEGKAREIDLLVIGTKGEATHQIAIEVKCYRTKAASGGNRGATDIFMKDVYDDLHILERYCEEGTANSGVALIMNDREGFVNPKKKEAKCWDYDISNGKVAGPDVFATQVGSIKTPVNIELKRQYTFSWKQYGLFWFAELEGVPQA